MLANFSAHGLFSQPDSSAYLETSVVPGGSRLFGLSEMFYFLAGEFRLFRPSEYFSAMCRIKSAIMGLEAMSSNLVNIMRSFYDDFPDHSLIPHAFLAPQLQAVFHFHV